MKERKHDNAKLMKLWSDKAYMKRMADECFNMPDKEIFKKHMKLLAKS